MADSPILLQIEGAVGHQVGFSFDDLRAMPEAAQIADVSRFQPSRSGDAVSLAELLDRAAPDPGVTHLTLHADRDDFHVSVPLDAIRDQGMVVYRSGDSPLSSDQGGPIRLLIRDPAHCHAGELDECANVKYLSRIELTVGRGRDTRPVDDAQHRALHEGQS